MHDRALRRKGKGVLRFLKTLHSQSSRRPRGENFKGQRKRAGRKHVRCERGGNVLRGGGKGRGWSPPSTACIEEELTQL